MRAFSAAPAEAPKPEAKPERTVFGGLKDQDRIFTNLYGRHDPFIKVSFQAVCSFQFPTALACPVVSFFVEAAMNEYT